MLQYDWQKISELSELDLCAGLPDFFQTLPMHTVTAPEIEKAVSLEQSGIQMVYPITQYLTEEAHIITLGGN